MKVILALAAVATATTDVFLASDRMAASAAVLNSVCDNSQPTALRLHLLAPTKEAAQTLATATETACDGAVVLPYGLAEFETLVRTRVGEEPMWTTALSKVERSKSTYAVPVSPWDRDEKHTSPYNHARFYAPQLIEGETLVMLDDDVIVQGDVTTLTTRNKAVAAGCQQWYVGHEGEFQSSTTLTYADVPYFGFGVLSAQDDPGCSHEGATECVPGDARDWFAEVARTDQAVARRASWPRFLRRLAAIKDDAFAASPDGDAFVDELYNTRAWNFGLVVIDLDAWKQHKLTAKYQGWLEANSRTADRRKRMRGGADGGDDRGDDSPQFAPSGSSPPSRAQRAALPEATPVTFPSSGASSAALLDVAMLIPPSHAEWRRAAGFSAVRGRRTSDPLGVALGFPHHERGGLAVQWVGRVGVEEQLRQENVEDI